jgi:hypothetical protein
MLDMYIYGNSRDEIDFELSVCIYRSEKKVYTAYSKYLAGLLDIIKNTSFNRRWGLRIFSISFEPLSHIVESAKSTHFGRIRVSILSNIEFLDQPHVKTLLKAGETKRDERGWSKVDHLKSLLRYYPVLFGESPSHTVVVRDIDQHIHQCDVDAIESVFTKKNDTLMFMCAGSWCMSGFRPIGGGCCFGKGIRTVNIDEVADQFAKVVYDESILDFVVKKMLTLNNIQYKKITFDPALHDERGAAEIHDEPIDYGVFQDPRIVLYPIRYNGCYLNFKGDVIWGSDRDVDRFVETESWYHEMYDFWTKYKFRNLIEGRGEPTAPRASTPPLQGNPHHLEEKP